MWQRTTLTAYELALQVLLDQEEIRGEEIEFILDKYPPQTPLYLLEEEYAANLPLTKEVHDLEYALKTQSKEETTWLLPQSLSKTNHLFLDSWPLSVSGLVAALPQDSFQGRTYIYAWRATSKLAFFTENSSKCILLSYKFWSCNLYETRFIITCFRGIFCIFTTKVWNAFFVLKIHITMYCWCYWMFAVKNMRSYRNIYILFLN